MGGIPLSRVFTNESGGSLMTSAALVHSLQSGRQMGGKEAPEESLSKHPYAPSHSSPPAEMLQAWKQ